MMSTWPSSRSCAAPRSSSSSPPPDTPGTGSSMFSSTLCSTNEPGFVSISSLTPSPSFASK